LTSYRLSDKAFSNQYIREGDDFFGHVEFRLYFNWYITKHIVFYCGAGQTLFNYFQQYNGENEKLNSNQIFQKTNDGFIANLGLAYRFRLDN
jgi:hypothetical protein